MPTENTIDNITRYTIFCGLGMFWATNLQVWITGETLLLRILIYPVLLSIMFCLVRLILNTGHYKSRISRLPFFLLNMLASLSIFTMARALPDINNIDNLRAILFSNTLSIITWLMPFFARWGLRKNLWLTVLPYLKKIIWIGGFYVLIVLVYMIFLGDISAPKDGKMYNSGDILFLSPLLILLSIHRAKLTEIFLGFTVIALLAIHMFISGERFAIGYSGILCLFCGVEILRMKLSNAKVIAILSCLIIIIAIFTSPMYSKTMDYQYNKYILQGKIFEDTRGNLATQPLDQMDSFEFIFGKGILGKYTWWLEQGLYSNAIYDRSDIEIGYMQIWLKGGLVMVILFISICLYAVYLGIFKSKNFITRFFSYMIISRLIIMTTAMPPRVGFEYFFFWLIIGACLSNEFRSITIEESLNIRKLSFS